MSEHINRAVDRLAEALYELSYRGRISINPDIRMLLCPGQPKPEDARHLHAIGLSAEVVELLADAIEQLLITHDTAGGPVDPTGADDFARNNPELAKDVASAFTGINLTELTRSVLDDTDPTDRMSVTRALDAMFGHIAEEDGDES
ncbi:hypothetical protein OIA45_49085 (plasmid) [Streptomyces chartreusis]|uniref:hypothetical protein n=1 Tax=Streptomyces chartreusis TaxID=1969 RepID=UPI0037DD391A|nr:hypothetical protein OIA45_49085 [Streptomyces chartreusis]